MWLKLTKLCRHVAIASDLSQLERPQNFQYNSSERHRNIASKPQCL